MLRFGIDVLLESNFLALHGQPVGLFTNLSAVNRDLVTSYDLFRQSPYVNLAALFTPEHGFSGTVPDGVTVSSGIDERTGIPIHSLYGNDFRPTVDQLKDVSVMVCDIQDIGSRYYTFLWSLTHLLEACGEYDVPVIILDRPNPLGRAMRGGGLSPDLASLVGRYDVPIQHGMTIGELASMINTRDNPTPASLTVVRCEGWDSNKSWEATDRLFVAPSPAMPHLSTVLQYPGACLIEGTTLSEGRGTSLPFEVVGAPDVDAWKLSDALNNLDLAGVRFRPHQFKPYISKYADQICNGVQVHITDPITFDALTVWLHILKEMRPYYTWRDQHFNRLIGDLETITMIDKGAPVAEITGRWDNYLRQFELDARPYLRY